MISVFLLKAAADAGYRQALDDAQEAISAEIFEPHKSFDLGQRHALEIIDELRKQCESESNPGATP